MRRQQRPVQLLAETARRYTQRHRQAAPVTALLNVWRLRWRRLQGPAILSLQGRLLSALVTLELGRQINDDELLVDVVHELEKLARRVSPP
jgi:hypothetical protein